MRRKTYFSAEEQWDRTAELFVRSEDGEYADITFIHLGYDWHLGRIAEPHRLFVVGDIVIISKLNGSGTRQPVWAVSSKGRVVRGYYLKYAVYLDENKQLACGPLRFIEPPGDLVGMEPHTPAVRRYVVETLRAG